MPFLRATLLALMGLAGLAGAALPLAAQAQINDSEARQAIVDLRNRADASDQTVKARAAELAATNQQLLEQITAVQRSLQALTEQLASVREELAQLRSADEQTARRLAEVQRASKDAGQTLNDRVRKLEPVRVTLDGTEVSVDPTEKLAYDEAIAALRGGEFDRAAVLLATFGQRWPDSAYAEPARFWLGNAEYGRRNYKEAVTAFRTFVGRVPQHPRAPEALLAVANSQVEMKDPRAARQTLEELLKTYPQSEAAQAGRQRLAALPPAQAPARR